MGWYKCNNGTKDHVVPQHNWALGLQGSINFPACNKLNQINVDELQFLHSVNKAQNPRGIFNRRRNVVFHTTNEWKKLMTYTMVSDLQVY